MRVGCNFKALDLANQPFQCCDDIFCSCLQGDPPHSDTLYGRAASPRGRGKGGGEHQHTCTLSSQGVRWLRLHNPLHGRRCCITRTVKVFHICLFMFLVERVGDTDALHYQLNPAAASPSLHGARQVMNDVIAIIDVRGSPLRSRRGKMC